MPTKKQQTVQAVGVNVSISQHLVDFLCNQRLIVTWCMQMFFHQIFYIITLKESAHAYLR